MTKKLLENSGVNKKGKIPSFTITELLVVMAISAIVVSLSFSVLGLLQQNVQGIQANYKLDSQIRLLEQQLTMDLQKFPSGVARLNGSELVFSSPIDSVVYSFEENAVLRSVDTLLKQSLKPQFYFTGEPISSGSIDAIKLSFLLKEQQKSIFLYKRNDAKSKNENEN